ncbi:MAG: hypothetical protein Q4D41_05180 [Prevotellaceae bacterium]|nr:hypothetical protein [Prevotellaceae bacterium]
MKKLILMIVALFTLSATTTKAMTYSEVCDEALFLTDKMAYELGLSSDQYDALYEINLDYLMSISSSSDIEGTYWTRRNLDIGYVLTTAQYKLFEAAEYFFRPVYWSSGLVYRIYSRYTNRKQFYCSKPTVYSTYKGGTHSWSKNNNKSWYSGRKFYTGTTPTPVYKKSSTTKTTTTKKVTNVKNNVNTKVNKTTNQVKSTNNQTIKKVNSTSSQVKQKASTTSTQVKKKASTTTSNAKQKVTNVSNQATKKVSNVNNQAKSTATKAATKATNTAKDVKASTTNVKTTTKKIVNNK